MTDWTFHPTLVSPFYGPFMGGNIVEVTPPEERAKILDLFRACLPQYTDPILREMLAHSWRPAKVAAWVIAAQQRHMHLTNIAARLLSQPRGVDHFCIALARLGGPVAAEALTEYVRGCSNGTLQIDDLDESVDPDWAVAAIEHIDPAEAAHACDLWRGFLGRQHPRLRDELERRLPRARRTLGEVMRLFDTEFRGSNDGDRSPS